MARVAEIAVEALDFAGRTRASVSSRALQRNKHDAYVSTMTPNNEKFTPVRASASVELSPLEAYVIQLSVDMEEKRQITD